MCKYDINLLVNSFVLDNKDNVNNKYFMVFEFVFDMLKHNYAWLCDAELFTFAYTTRDLFYQFDNPNTRYYIESEAQLMRDIFAERKTTYDETVALFFDSIHDAVMSHNTEDTYIYMIDFLIFFYRITSFKNSEIDYNFMKDLCDDLADHISKD